MRFGILGPVEARCDGVRIDLRPGRERSLLALLVLNAGRLLTADHVVTLLWEEPPETARAQVYNLVSGLRRRLHHPAPGRPAGTDVLVTADGGYRLEPARHHTDLAAFRSAAAQGRYAAESGARHRAAELLTQALGHWRGEALSGCAAPFAAAARQALEDERWSTVEALLDVHLGLGRYERVLADVGPWLEQQPYREDLYRRQMLALAAQGRRADALASYRRAYRRLGEDLGVEPGPALRDLHEQLLRGAAPTLPDRTEGTVRTDGAARARPSARRSGATADPARLPGPRPAGATSAGKPSAPGPAVGEPSAGEPPRPRPVPRQLPPPPARLYGRDALLRELRDALAPPSDHPTALPAARTPGAPVVVLTGPGGVGKTALALHTAHRLSARFPDGQLYADLRGSHSSPADPPETAARFLRALGVDGQDVPADADERVADLRSRLAGRSVLLLLDDVRDETQLRPLLPADGGCAVLATSRNRLTGLTALADARVLGVGTLTPADAAALLAGLVGAERAGADRTATAEVARLCGHLPLALRIAGARLAARPDWTVAGFRDRLAQQHHRLDQLAAGDLDVRAGIALSYRSLSPGLRTALRRLALLESHSVPGWVVGTLAGRPSEPWLHDQLVERNLLETCGRDQAGQPRYQLHALVRDFARERTLAEDTGEERDAAVERVLRAWLALASEAAGRLGHGGVLDPVAPAPGAPPDAADAARRHPERWFAAEQANLLNAALHACRLRLPELAGDLALQLSGYLVIRFYEAEREAVVRAAIASWGERPTADRRLSRLHFALCWTLYQQDRYAELTVAAERGLRVARDLGDPEVVADAAWQLGRATALRGRLTEAAAYYRRTVQDAEHLGLSARAHVYALTGLANVLADLGEPAEAVRSYEQALARHPGADRTRVVMLLRCAEAHSDAGEGARALELLTAAAAIVRAIGDDVGAAHVERGRALVDLAHGRWHDARDRLTGVLSTLRTQRETSGEAGVLRSLGDAALGAGQWDDARHHLDDALALHTRMDLPVEIARTRARLAVALRLAGDPSPAHRHADACRAILLRHALGPACLRLPAHVRRLLPPADATT
ncbi:AfsR/SARP family transcriptional regulator [Streptomyces sp. GSL17-111]|uniref:AfsR/SARP family transcriptional regulator n=1 Tax=Streptomyces sp. GSL17-111 TaxID=3121596 RepID=UPI0030F3C944